MKRHINVFEERLQFLLQIPDGVSKAKFADQKICNDIGVDLLVELNGPSGKLIILAKCKSRIRPVEVPSLLDQLKKASARLIQDSRFSRRGARSIIKVIAAPWISPAVADDCAGQKTGWFDLAGNCLLSFPGFHLERLGHPNPAAEKPQRPRLSSPHVGRVLRALLAPDNLGNSWTQRDLQAHCVPGVSLALVNKVVQQLREEGFLVDGTTRRFGLKQPEKLLTLWRDQYRFDRHERRNCFTLLSGNQLKARFLEVVKKMNSLSGGHALMCSFSAADFLAPYVRQSKEWVFLHSKYADMFIQKLDGKLVSSGENVVILIPEDDGVFYLGQELGAGANVTNPIQTYLDLWHSGSRGQEAAQALLDQILKPIWNKITP
ncbi:MAG: type IV toxin-antitoxin system AbiEi family antitoxin [Verrucomicrobiota bacterium]|nr:type IV toxin-antitoxin system AbiEi family antitoxin [Verrucomicrobiota bacterium]